ncbi:unnamed protein product [Closterium sp. Naga37s-1]|nr:unnamed protein product [Closterium sp. Naga37s-1]
MGPVPARENSGRVDSAVQSGAGGGLAGWVRGSSVGLANGEEGDEGRAGADGDRGGSTAADRHTSSSHAQESEAGAAEPSALDSLRSSAMFSSGRKQRQRGRYSKVVTVREYVQGVMVAEIPRSKLQHDLVRRRGPTRRAGRKAGELIYKGHRSYDLMTAIQLGLRHSTGRATPPPVAPSAAAPPSELPPPSAAIPAASTPTTLPTAAPFPAALSAPAAPAPVAPTSADLRAEDFVAADRMWFPPEGSSCTPPHNTLPFTWRDYAPKAFSHANPVHPPAPPLLPILAPSSELRAMFGITPADYTLSLSLSLHQLSPPPSTPFLLACIPFSELRAMFGINPADYMVSLELHAMFGIDPADYTLSLSLYLSLCQHPSPTRPFFYSPPLHSPSSELRAMFGIDPADYTLSLCGDNALRELSSPGKSGSVFYLSDDDRFIIKTMRASEVRQQQHQHPDPHQQHNHPQRYRRRRRLHTVLSSPSTLIRFVVMANVFVTDLRMHRRFDLKGSSQGRSTEKVAVDETTTLKDLDLDLSFHMPASWRALMHRVRLQTVLSSPSTLIRFVVMANVFVTDLRMHRRFDLKGSSQGRSTEKVAVDETTTLKDWTLISPSTCPHPGERSCTAAEHMGACTFEFSQPPLFPPFPLSTLSSVAVQAYRAGHGVPAEAAHNGLQPAVGSHWRHLIGIILHFVLPLLPLSVSALQANRSRNGANRSGHDVPATAAHNGLQPAAGGAFPPHQCCAATCHHRRGARDPGQPISAVHLSRCCGCG